MRRRKFMALGGSGLLSSFVKPSKGYAADRPIVISTWDNQKANETAFKSMNNGAKAVEAVEAGVRVVEADPNDMSVGLGGRPDREGNVTLDACIMDHLGNCGSVCYLREILHPITVARMVMQETPHVILAGDGAQKFALSKGMKKQNLLTTAAKEQYQKWLKTSKYKPIINIEAHDTIGMLALDKDGRISGACTTSGLAYKMAGRVGDSPIIGAGLFVDNEVGGATATGMGEAVLKSVGSFLVVELMRQGYTPQQACEEAVMRIVRKQDYKDLQVGYLAINKKGEIGAFSIQPKFVYTVQSADRVNVLPAKSHINS